MPPDIAAAWSRLKALLLARADEHWEVWTEWYEDRLAGRPADRDLELARVLLPDELWKQGPKAVNSEIRRLIDESRHKVDPPDPLPDLPDENTLPKQTPRAAIFVPDPSGAIGLAPSGPTDRLADTPEVQDFYDDVRDKLDSLLSLGGNALGSRLDDEAEKFRSKLPNDMAAAIERRVWSSGNTMRRILAGHDAVAAEDYHADKLDPGAAERLRDVVETFNQLAFADPSLRLRDASRPGPQEQDHTTIELTIGIEVSAKAATNRALTTADAGDELAEQIAVAKEAGTGVPDKLAAELARDTHRNFFAALITHAYRTVRNLPKTARGEGGFISRNYLAALYAAAGAATFKAAQGGISWTVENSAELLNFLLANAGQLKRYSAYAFRPPGFKRMIEWLEAQTRDDGNKDEGSPEP
jgi:hypothetical protein